MAILPPMDEEETTLQALSRIKASQQKQTSRNGLASSSSLPSTDRPRSRHLQGRKPLLVNIKKNLTFSGTSPVASSSSSSNNRRHSLTANNSSKGRWQQQEQRNTQKARRRSKIMRSKAIFFVIFFMCLTLIGYTTILMNKFTTFGDPNRTLAGWGDSDVGDVFQPGGISEARQPQPKSPSRRHDGKSGSTSKGSKMTTRKASDKAGVPDNLDQSVALKNVHPRIILLDKSDETSYRSSYQRELADDPMMHAPPGEEAVPQLPYMRNKETDKNCVPMSDWQTASFPNCNSLHELDMRSAGPNVGKISRQTKNPETGPVGFEDVMLFLGRGWFRDTWKYDHHGEDVVIKTLRLERDFMDEYFELHRRDAVAMERLTHSPFIMDVYGFCGQSAINEIADFPYGMNSLEKFNRNLRGRDSEEVNLLKLQVAASMAVGVAHIHHIDDQPSMVHYDLNPRNVAIVRGGKPKINDFNIAEFLRIDPKTNQTCGFEARLHEPWWRAPEEVHLEKKIIVDEKVDVYALGALIFHTLTTHSPRGKMKKPRMEEVREAVLRGEQPAIHTPYDKSSDKVHKVMRKAMRMCFEKDPVKRATSREVAELLMKTLTELKEEGYGMKTFSPTKRGKV